MIVAMGWEEMSHSWLLSLFGLSKAQPCKKDLNSTLQHTKYFWYWQDERVFEDSQNVLQNAAGQVLSNVLPVYNLSLNFCASK